MAAMYNDGGSDQQAERKTRLGRDRYRSLLSLLPKQLLNLGGSAVEGLYTNVSFFTEDPDPAVQKYVSEFESHYGITPNFHAALAFDAINLLG